MEEKGSIGIPKALMFYRYFPFWKTFFEALGWKVICSDEVGKRGKLVYFEDSCLPMKLLVTHSVLLKDRVEHLFIPRLVSLDRSYIMCPKFRGAPDIIRLATEGSVPIIDETIDLRTREHSLRSSFLRIGQRLGATVKESKEAFQRAEAFSLRFKREWGDRVNALPLKDLFRLDLSTPFVKNISPPLAGGDKGEGEYDRLYSPPPSPIKGGGKYIGRTSFRVAFVGHPYNLFDSDINKDILSFARGLGMKILTPDLLSEEEIDRQISGLSKEIYWSSGREIVGSLFHFLSGGVDGVVFLTSFKCGIDALLQEFVKRRLKTRGEGTFTPFLILSLDEHSGREGLTTRLEAFRDVMEERKGKGKISDNQISITKH